MAVSHFSPNSSNTNYGANKFLFKISQINRILWNWKQLEIAGQRTAMLVYVHTANIPIGRKLVLIAGN